MCGVWRRYSHCRLSASFSCITFESICRGKISLCLVFFASLILNPTLYTTVATRNWRTNSQHRRTRKSGFKSTISVQPNVNYVAGRPPFDVFNTESKDIEFYLERLQEYFTAYDIRNDTDSPAKRRASLLTSLGSGAYRVLKDLFLLDKYKDFWPWSLWAG